MVRVIAEDFIGADRMGIVTQLHAEPVAKTRLEPLCIACDLFVGQKDAIHVVFVEQWPDRAALDAHCHGEHFRRPVPLIDRYRRRQGTVILMGAFAS